MENIRKQRQVPPAPFIILLLSILCTLVGIYVLNPQLHLFDPYLDSYFDHPTTTTTTSVSSPPTVPVVRNKTAMCSISIYDEAYLDEFVDYHQALGFDHFFIYDNSERFELKQWGQLKGDHVEVIHFPGKGMQVKAYAECWRKITTWKRTTRASFEWAAFFDTDEFLVLKNHDHVADMLQEYCPRGGLAVNWLFFATDNNWNIYSPQPVTKRFIFYKDGTNMHMKTIARVDDIKSVPWRQHPNPHNFLMFKDGDSLTMKDSNGKRVDGPFNKEGPTDVVVLHHYHHKSAKEYVEKKSRGRGSTGTEYDNKERTIKDLENALAATKRVPNDYEPNDPKFTFDDSAWQFLKKKVPAYALFDEIAVSPFTKQQQQGASF